MGPAGVANFIRYGIDLQLRGCHLWVGAAHNLIGIG
jgi:hypothetical protein